jgi:hypothetical protein
MDMSYFHIILIYLWVCFNSMSTKFPLVLMGSSLPGLRTWDSLLSPSLKLAEIFRFSFLQNNLQTSSLAPQKL